MSDEDRTVYEDFIIELLRHEIMVDYRADKKEVTNFYNSNYKQKGKCSFHNFCHRLYYLWYILKIVKQVIHFDKEWTKYISNLDRAQVVLAKKKVPEEKYCDEKSCRLCLVKFSNEDEFNEHRKSTKHQVRMQYLQDKKDFVNLGHLKFKLATVQTPADTSLKLKFQIKVNKTHTMIITNTSGDKNPLEIIDVVQINSYQKELVTTMEFKNNKTLHNGQDFKITINGCFGNSASYPLLVVIAYRLVRTEKIRYFLQEVQIEVESEFSDLKSKKPYVRPAKKLLPVQNEEIVAGEAPELFKSYYTEKYPLTNYPIPRFLQKKLHDLITSYPNFTEASPFESGNSSLYRRFATILKVNPILSEDNYCELLNSVISIEEHQITLDIRTYDTTSKLRHVKGLMYDLEVPGLAEARPSLIIYDSVYVKENNQEKKKYQGIVSRVFESSVRLNFSRKFSKLYKKDKLFCIEFGYNRRQIKVQKQAVALAREHGIISYLYPKKGKEDCAESNSQLVTYFNTALNEEQKRAVLNLMNNRTAPYLIFGPPGTGKTVTVVESVLQIWKNYPKSRILVCAPSNSATNEIAIRLTEILRPKSKDLYRLISYSYGGDSSLSALGKNINIDKEGNFFMPSMGDLLDYRIVLTTLVTAARLVNGGIPDSHFSHVFIDECGYSTESESLVPIAGILSNKSNIGKVVGQLILAGDPRQLGPVVRSNFVKFCGFNISLLERLIDTCDIYARDETRPIPYDERFVTKLVRNYRSHDAILSVPNRLFYHNELIPCGDSLSNAFTGWEHLKTPGFPVIFHHVVGEDTREQDSPSFFNIQEIEVVMGYLKKLMGQRVKDKVIGEDDIGIISPYKKQVKKLQKACAKQGWHDLSVGSVEQFQGTEKLVVIISTVRSKNVNKFEDIDKKCQLGFVRNAKRFNVAVTRAKALLIVIGNGDVLKSDKNWRSFIEHCVNHNSVAGQSFHVSDDDYLQEEIAFANELLADIHIN